jgi:adenosine deaminase
MKRSLLLNIILLSYSISTAQDVASYFNSIRSNRALLTAFFNQMPKGGDLHHHYSGSVYAETYINYVVQKDYYLNTRTLEVAEKKSGKGPWEHFSSLKPDDYRERLLQKWSVKDYNGVSYPSDKLFFETFPLFNVGAKGTIDSGLLEIKRRAVKENVSYIETMFTSIPFDKNITDAATLNERLRDAQKNRNDAAINKLLDSMYTILVKNAKDSAAKFNNEYLAPLHHKLQIDDDHFTMRYQVYVSRTKEPMQVFSNLITCFEAASHSDLVVGVNILSPEDNQTSMNDYWLHMLMFRYCHTIYQSIKYAMHAGELALGFVKPEDLSWHINAAVYIAGASRIGHGVDLAYESKPYELLNDMRQRNIAVEINLKSNEFILRVKDDAHPIMLYKQFNVPIVICTDDAGVLRSNLTEQFVLLASRYKDISYTEIKAFVYNSIDYSFIKEAALREKIRSDLDKRFAVFEAVFK